MVFPRPPGRLLPGPHARARVFFLVFFAGASALLPFLALFYRGEGVGEGRIGVLTGLQPLTVLFGSTVWGAIADYTQRHKTVMLSLIVAVALTAIVLSAGGTFARLFLLVLVFAFFFAPIVPLADNSVLHMLGTDADRFGKLRMWGGVGWGGMAAVVGWLIERHGIEWSFYMFVFGMALSFVAARGLPPPRVSPRTRFFTALRELLATAGWAPFLFAVFLGGAGLGVMHNYLFLYLQDIGAGGRVMGVSMTVATAAELSFFFYADRLLTRFGPRRLLQIALLAGALRLLLYSVTSIPGLVLAIQVLHGPAFGLLYVSAVAFAYRNAPDGLGATAQGVVNGVNFGLGAFVGALSGGLLYEALGPFVMFRITGFILAVPALLFLRPSPRSRSA